MFYNKRPVQINFHQRMANSTSKINRKKRVIQSIIILLSSIFLILEMGFFKESMGRFALSNLLFKKSASDSNLPQKYDTNNNPSTFDDEKQNIVPSSETQYHESSDDVKDNDISNLETEALQDVYPNNVNDTNISKLKLEENAELHVVGIYEATRKEIDHTTVLPPIAKVTIDRPNQKVVLLLNSYHAAKWLITTTQNTQLSQILLNSYEDRSEILVNDKEYKPIIFKMKNRPYTIEGKEFAEFKEEVKERLDRDYITSFTGQYKATQQAFLVNNIDNSQSMHITQLAVNHATSLPTETFLTQINGVVGYYNVKGELQEPLVTHFNIDHMLYLKEQKHYYQIQKTNLGQYDQDQKLITTIDLSLDVPQFSWPKGIVYNKHANKLAVLTSHVYSYLYQYDLKTKKWSATNLGRDNAYSDIAYDEETKNYVLISTAYGRSDITLSFYNSESQLVSQESLTIKDLVGFEELYDPANEPPNAINLFATKNNFILAVKGNRFSTDTVRLYLYDKKTKKVSLTWFEKKN